MILDYIESIKSYLVKDNSFVKVLKNKSFVKLWVMQILSQITANMLNFILMIYIYQRTGSTIAVGVLLAFYALPSIILGPFSGAVVDVWDRKKILVFSSLFQAVLVLTYLGVGDNIWPIYTIIFFYSLCDEFFGPAIGATIPSVVKKDDLPVANTLFTLTSQSSFIVGYLFGGILLRIFQDQLFFPFAAFFLGIAALIAYLIPREIFPKREKIHVDIADFQARIIDGYRFIKNEPMVKFPIILMALVQIVIGIGVIILPSFSKQVLAINLADSSFVVIVPGVFGAIIGSLLMERLSKRFQKRRLVIWGLFAISITIILMALSGAIVRPPTLISIPSVIILGISFIFVNVPLQTLLQEYTPLSIRGRVYGVLSMVITLAASLPSLVAATLVDVFGVTTVLITVGIALFALSFYVKKGKYASLDSPLVSR